MNDDARTGRGGFTLLEIVIALTALALVTVICYGAFHLGIRAMERGEVAVVAAQRLRVATDVIIRQVKSIVPYKARNRDDEEYVFFMGTASSMAFISAAGLEGGGGLTRVRPPPPSRPAALMNAIELAVPMKKTYSSSSRLRAL